MNQLLTAVAFTPLILLEYIKLYDAYVKAKITSVEFVNEPQFDVDN